MLYTYQVKAVKVVLKLYIYWYLNIYIYKSHTKYIKYSNSAAYISRHSNRFNTCLPMTSSGKNVCFIFLSLFSLFTSIFIWIEISRTIIIRKHHRTKLIKQKCRLRGMYKRLFVWCMYVNVDVCIYFISYWFQLKLSSCWCTSKRMYNERKKNGKCYTDR